MIKAAFICLTVVATVFLPFGANAREKPLTVERIVVDVFLGGPQQFARINSVATNDFGQLAIQGEINGSAELGLSGANLWLFANGAFTPYVKIGDPVPGLTDELDRPLKFSDPRGNPVITNTGRVAFYSELDNIFGNPVNGALWEGVPFTYGLATQSNTVMPNPQDPFEPLRFSSQLLLNELGEVVWEANGAIWIARAVEDLTMIAKAGDAAPNRVGEPFRR